MSLREAAQMALEMLTCPSDDFGHRCGRCDSKVDRNGAVREALRDALAEAHPPAALPESVELSDEKILALFQEMCPRLWFKNEVVAFARAVLAAARGKG